MACADLDLTKAYGAARYSRVLHVDAVACEACVEGEEEELQCYNMKLVSMFARS